MHLRIAIGLILLFTMLAGAPCRAAGPCPPQKANADWSSRCFEGKDPVRRVKAKYLKNIGIDKNGMATIRIGSPYELLAVDRRGLVVVPNIYHVGDFDFPYAENGLGRFAMKAENRAGKPVSKCGYFRAPAFKVVVPAVYDQCQAVHDGTALVCNDCVRYCTEYDCQNSVFIGGKLFVLDDSGKVIREPAPLSLADVCGGAQYVRVENRPGTPYLGCLQHPDSPFK
jgi:hypothetical protein